MTHDTLNLRQNNLIEKFYFLCVGSLQVESTARSRERRKFNLNKKIAKSGSEGEHERKKRERLNLKTHTADEKKEVIKKI